MSGSEKKAGWLGPCVDGYRDRLWLSYTPLSVSSYSLVALGQLGRALEIQCGGEGNIDRVRDAIQAAARELAPELLDWSPWIFAGPGETERRLVQAGFGDIRCWLEERPTYPDDLNAFVRTSILAAHFDRLPKERRQRFAAAVLARVRPPLDYVRLNASALRAPT